MSLLQRNDGATVVMCDGCARWEDLARDERLPHGWRELAERDHTCPECAAPMDARPFPRPT